MRQEAKQLDSGQLGNQLECLSQILEPINDLRAQGQEILNLNIDHLVINNPCKRMDIAKLTDLLNDVRTRNDLEIVNHKPTRFQRGQKAS